MFRRIITAIFGSRNARVLKRIQNDVHRINTFEAEIEALKDNAFPEQTRELRNRLFAGQSLEEILPEAFALVREAGKRTLGLRHFDVQMVGGVVLHEGNIAEMRTGEGKTLVATLAAYLNALSGKGVHIVTVNDYLARRDAEWMGKIYSFLGMSTGVIVAGLDNEARKAAYRADITYGTNNEFGFDYLRDNMKFSKDARVQRELHFAIVDEVDSILIDEARTPLIISGPIDDRSDLYTSINKLIPKLARQMTEDGPGDYSIDEKTKQAYLTEDGNIHAEALLKDTGIIGRDQGLYDPVNLPVLHHMNSALRAHSLFSKDVDYIIQNNEVVIVDEFTGRTMPGRRWSDGLHQAIEAKEGVSIQNENQTLATITYQNYFRLYAKLSGMTGTADTEAHEFQQIYGLEVIVIPTNVPMIRDDQPDMVFISAREKFQAIMEDIKDCIARGQPVLVGTASIEVSELLSGMFAKEKIRHQVLNAKFHEKEAEIVAQAGSPGTVTIATNMAGRGTDIVLGGNYEAELKKLVEADAEQTARIREDWRKKHEQVIASGGLRIVGTERHESRRIDNQLRGRSGRQGDPGSSRFYLSLEDNLMRIFASERVAAIMQKLGMQEGEAIESTLVSRSIENAQRKVEGHNFDIRKHLLEYDDVANDQRKEIYKWRNELLEQEDVSEDIKNMRMGVIEEIINRYIPAGSHDELWNIPGLTDALERTFNVRHDIGDWLLKDVALEEETLREKIITETLAFLERKASGVPADLLRRLERDIMLDILDRHWKEHLVAMDSLRQGIGLRSYAQKNPKQEYKREAFEMFGRMLEEIRYAVIEILAKVQFRTERDIELVGKKQEPDEKKISYSHPASPEPLAGHAGGGKTAATPYVRNERKIGRNEPCPCGSGKKYKQCHGRLA
ncbi:MAG: preprotein translocase subunit SecA [Gammaproteobacteria bacterium RIFCSPLOWO2_02_FULL_56_15]|nr:MAG: preprotein translocase subunit SecA [Gammaproteobacteria bacterium RIFCSPLOWO2_02_FULL_56_15]